MNLQVKRFPQGHALYSEAMDIQDSSSIHYKANFGQMEDQNGNFICYTMERRGTLIPEGTYNFSYYKSPANKMVVLLLHNVPSFEFIEVHIANYPHEVKGCTAVGTNIDVHKPMLIGSGKAFMKLMDLLNMCAGNITYSTLQTWV